MYIEHIVNESGDWVVLRVNGEEFYSGHSIPDFVWLTLLTSTDTGVKTTSKEISDRAMEEGNY